MTHKWKCSPEHQLYPWWILSKIYVIKKTFFWTLNLFRFTCCCCRVKIEVNKNFLDISNTLFEVSGSSYWQVLCCLYLVLLIFAHNQHKTAQIYYVMWTLTRVRKGKESNFFLLQAFLNFLPVLHTLVHSDASTFTPAPHMGNWRHSEIRGSLLTTLDKTDHVSL